MTGSFQSIGTQRVHQLTSEQAPNPFTAAEVHVLQEINTSGCCRALPELVVGHGVEQPVAGILDDLIDGDHLALHSIQEAGTVLVTPVHMHAHLRGACVLCKKL